MSEARRESAMLKRVRGIVLRCLYDGQVERRSRMDALQMWSFLGSMGFDIGQNMTCTVLEDLSERKCLTFESEPDKLRGGKRIFALMITPKGRDIVTEDIVDPQIEV